MDNRQKNIESGNRYRSKSYQVGIIIRAYPVKYYVLYFEVFIFNPKNQNRKKPKTYYLIVYYLFFSLFKQLTIILII